MGERRFKMRSAERVLLPLLVLALGCRSVPPSRPPGALEPDLSGRVGSSAGSQGAQADARSPDDGPSLDAYRASYLRALARLTKTREAKIPPEDLARSDGASPFSVEVLKKIGQSDALLVSTVGLGRRSEGRGDRLELLAYVSQYGRKVGEVLVALGRAMHARAEEGVAWKAYDTIVLDTPENGMKYFDLRPAGEVELDRDTRVALLKVIPMSEEEFEKSQKNASGEWDDPNANAKASERWGRIVD